MYEFTKQIVKDKGDVDLLIPSSVEPHDWEPTPKDIANIQDADLFVYNKMGLTDPHRLCLLQFVL